MKQTTFASLNFAAKKKPTRREQFLGEMEQVVPWTALEALIEPHYPKSGRRGRPPMPLTRMLRIHFLQQWYALSDPAIAPALLYLGHPCPRRPWKMRFTRSNRCADLSVSS